MNVLSGTDQVLYNINLNQQTLAKETSQLSSGLRIQNAADDPSGNAIAQGLQTKINGLQQSVENVQEGNNLLTVADGAAANIQNILQRINSLVIESNSDINSNTQLVAIQSEINQMLLEINRIAQNSNFNGVHLFDGSHDTYVGPAPGTAADNVQFVQINPGLLPDGSIPTGDTVANSQLTNSLLASQAPGNAIESNSTGFITGIMVLQLTEAGNNLIDPSMGMVAGPGVVLNQILYSNNSAFGAGQGNESIMYNVIAADGGANDGSGPGTPVSEPIPDDGQTINFDLANVGTSDVGTAIAYAIVAPRASGGGTALTINDGGDEGATISISLPTLNTSALNISNISILRPTQLDDQMGTGAPTGVDQSNQYAAMDAQFFVGQALDMVAETRAQIGAQMIQTQEDANNGNIAAINYTASESSIADLDVGTAVTQFTKNQILGQVGMSVLSQMQISARALTGTLIGAFSGGFSAVA